jgi:ABC-type uncharacterized transport system substrate-binding protein
MTLISSGFGRPAELRANDSSWFTSEDHRPRRWLKRYLAPLAVATWACLATNAQAHPHVWVTMNTDLLYAPDGSVTGLRQAWAFDDMFSAYSTMGIPAKTKGQFTREELQPLAQVNVESLKDYAYFTYAWIDGKRQKDAFTDPIDYWLTYDDKANVLTLHFTLPFKEPVKAKVLKIEIYDPEFFIDFGFTEKNPVKLVGAPLQCALWTEKPPDVNFLSPQNLNRAFVPSEANIGMGMDFADKILVQCP